MDSIRLGAAPRFKYDTDGTRTRARTAEDPVRPASKNKSMRARALVDHGDCCRRPWARLPVAHRILLGGVFRSLLCISFAPRSVVGRSPLRTYKHTTVERRVRAM